MEETKTKTSKSWCETMMKGWGHNWIWFPVIGMLFVGALFLLGYYSDASTLRILWLSFAGFWFLMIVFGWIMMGSMMKWRNKRGRTWFNWQCCSPVDGSETAKNCCEWKNNRCC
ncbi:MAG: hypothetical protein JSV25_10080 [Spirochaetota bacterium]|nr:MAG: hypothetical protein JSV25_10080 [Spirochaetota bacterium]